MQGSAYIGEWWLLTTTTWSPLTGTHLWLTIENGCDYPKVGQIYMFLTTTQDFLGRTLTMFVCDAGLYSELPNSNYSASLL